MRSPVIIGAAIAAISSAAPASAQFNPTLPGSLTPDGTFTLPAGTFDVLPDGRLLAITPDGDVLLQSAPNSSGYTTTNTLPAPNPDGFGASFLSISPNAGRVALGNNEFNANNAVLVYDFTEFTQGLGNPVLPEATITTPNTSAAWADESTLFVTGARSTDFRPLVNRLDITTGDVDTVITPAGGFSGGVAYDHGALLVGDGDTGQVRAFDADFPAAPLTFADGTAVATANSAGTIDTLGDLLLIAGQQFGSPGSAFVLDRSTGAAITLQPAGPDAFYGGYFNPATNQLVVTAGGTGYVYAIPAPATLAIAPVAIFATRRRRA